MNSPGRRKSRRAEDDPTGDRGRRGRATRRTDTAGGGGRVRARREDEIPARPAREALQIDKASHPDSSSIPPHLDRSDLARRATYEIAGSFMAMAMYDQAALWFERYARESPKGDRASDALRDAIVLRLSLGQAEQASADADADRAYGSVQPAETARILFAIAERGIDHADLEGARRKLTAAIPLIDHAATLDVQVRAHAGLGRALAQLGRKREAAEERREPQQLRDPVGAWVMPRAWTKPPGSRPSPACSWR